MLRAVQQRLTEATDMPGLSEASWIAFSPSPLRCCDKEPSTTPPGGQPKKRIRDDYEEVKRFSLDPAWGVHPARTDGCRDFVSAEHGAGLQGHPRRHYTGVSLATVLSSSSSRNGIRRDPQRAPFENDASAISKLCHQLSLINTPVAGVHGKMGPLDRTLKRDREEQESDGPDSAATATTLNNGEDIWMRPVVGPR